MPSLNESRAILNKNPSGKKYTEEDVKAIVEVLNNLATIDFEKFKIKTGK